MPEVSCIIAAYNERPRISDVLRTVYKHPLIKEVVVVDDGSRDDTSDVVRKFEGVRLIVHEKNTGKSRAMVTGINASGGDLLFFLDADLIGLTPRNISELIEPVISGRADITISLRKNAPWIFKQIGIDFISGERVFPKTLIQDHLPEIQNLPQFGLESFMNKLIIKQNYRIKIVFWENVISPWPHEKRGWFRGVRGFLLMVLDVLRTISLVGVVYQIVRMLSLRSK